MMANSNSESIFSAIRKLNKILSRREKLKSLLAVALSPITWSLEIVTASALVMLAAAMANPQSGIKYLSKIGITQVPAEKVILVIASICGISYLIKSFVGVLEVFVQNRVIQSVNYAFKERLIYKYTNMDYETYLKRSTSFIMSVINHDSDVMFSSGMLALAVITSEAFVFMFLLGMVIYMNPSLSLSLFLIITTLSFILYKYILPIFYGWGSKLQFYGLKTTDSIMNICHGFKEVILFSKREYFAEQYNQYALEKTKIMAASNSANNGPRYIIEAVFVNLFVFSVIYLSLGASHPEKMLATLGGYLYLGFRLMPGLNRMFGQINIFKSTIPYINRVYDEFNNELIESNFINEPAFCFKDSIKLTEIDFAYRGETKPVLKNISLEVKKGECVGIIGSTGSGKSTMVDLMLGLLSPQRGQILIDGIYHVNTIQWHKKIGYVPQSFFLLNDTVRANIAFGIPQDEVDDERIWHVVKQAQLYDLVINLNDGLDTVVNERGMRLSGGERQRIGIARALYPKTCEVLIFDEATSALDYETEAKLMDAIYALTSEYTIIMISHRLSTLKKCNIFYQIKDASITKLAKKEFMMTLSQDSVAV